MKKALTASLIFLVILLNGCTKIVGENTMNEKQIKNAIIILGNGRAKEIYRDRILFAKENFDNETIVILSGKCHDISDFKPGSKTEVDYMMEYIEDLEKEEGKLLFPRDRLIPENESTSTEENCNNSKEILKRYPTIENIYIPLMRPKSKWLRNFIKDPPNLIKNIKQRWICEHILNDKKYEIEFPK